MALLLNALADDAVAGAAPCPAARRATTCALSDLAARDVSGMLLAPRYACAASFLLGVQWLDRQLGGAFRLARDGGLVVAQTQGPADAAYRAQVQGTFGEKWQFAGPTNLPPYGSQHAKFVVLAYDAFVRVAIVSNNLIPKDFERKTGSVFVQTFPLRPATGVAFEQPATAAGKSDFGTLFSEFLRKMQGGGVPVGPLVAQLARFDFSGARADFAASVPGTFAATADADKWGHTRVAALLRRLGPAESHDDERLFFQYSSHGSFYTNRKPNLLEQFAASFSVQRTAPPAAGPAARAGSKRPADPGVIDLTSDDESTGPAARASSSSSASAFLRPPRPLPVELVWPAADFVRRSTEGWSGGSSVPGPNRHHTPDVTQFWRLYEGAPGAGRDRSIPHIKTFGRYRPLAAGAGIGLAWLYTGSSNCSGAAWGVVENPKGKSRQVRILSYEAGVLCTPGRWAAGLAIEAAQVAMGRFPAEAWSGCSGMAFAGPGGEQGVRGEAGSGGGHAIGGNGSAFPGSGNVLGRSGTPPAWRAGLPIPGDKARPGGGADASQGSGSQASQANASNSPGSVASLQDDIIARPGTPTPSTVVFRATPWPELRHASRSPPPGIVWLPVPFRLPPRRFPAGEPGWAIEGAPQGGVGFPGRDGYGRFVGEGAHSVVAEPLPVAPDPGPLVDGT
ncbi:tyrosyl-DNA phosphodiesterase-domain-containing protein [Hyaloraphidium curvatum]|nr:tyrosyl-DNA phosphodiesterase-domain-containing protein [Hyaloraphidium curvatum]